MQHSRPNNPLPYLHTLSDFRELLIHTARARGMDTQLIEKDYWLMHCLHGLAQCGVDFDMKGGTSLSKGYGIIQRFSEDIDLRVTPPADLPIKTSQTRESHVAKRKAFFDQLQAQIAIPGIEAVQADPDFADDYMRHVGLRLVYPSLFDPMPVLKEGILLEIGFDDTEPNFPRTISSWAFDQAEASGLLPGKAMVDNRAVGIRCYHPGFTFVEKLQAVSTKYRLERSGTGMPKNFLRHYSDLYALLAAPEVQAFIGTERYHQRKRKRFRTQDNLDIRTNEAFWLPDAAVFAAYEQAYARIATIFYGKPPTLRQILDRIAENIDRL